MDDDPAFRPLIGIGADLIGNDPFAWHKVGKKYVDGVADGAGGTPLLIPAVGADALALDELMAALHGLFLTGAPSNVDPAHYAGPPPRPDNQADAARDTTTLPLIRSALRHAVPIFAVCRGIQELNVALGGSLHQHVHEVPGRFDHRSNKSLPEDQRYAPAHEVRLRPGGVFARLYPERTRLTINSLHGQAIDRLADGLFVEAVAEDGTIEAVSLPEAPAWTLGVQWHPEWQPRANPDYWSLFRAFRAACRARAQQMMERHGRPARLAG